MQSVRAFEPAAGVDVVAGPGNNGGDGFVAARLLAERGYQAKVLLVGEVGRLEGGRCAGCQGWTGPIVPAEPAALAGADVIDDALFGAGLDRPVEGLRRAMIEGMNAQSAPSSP